MKKPTKKHLEAVSRLLQAVRRCGANFKTGSESWIEMPDGTRHTVLEEHPNHWLFSTRVDAFLIVQRAIPRDHSEIQIQICLLRHHANYLEKFALPPAGNK